MSRVIGFDVYGTLVDPVAMGQHLHPLLGEQTTAFGQLWHDKKVEFAFRRALMEQYKDFSVCTRQALQYCLQQFGIELSEQEQEALLAKFSQLDAFADVRPGLQALQAGGHRLVAFSNGPEAAVRTLLAHAGVLEFMEQVVSVDDLGTYKPSPRVYHYLLERTNTTADNSWMISSNPWDVIGGKGAGLNAAWIQRDPERLFDPWELSPDLVVTDLIELSHQPL